MNEYVLTINHKDYRAEVLDLTAEQARVLINGQEYLVGLRQLGRSMLKTTEVRKPEDARVETPPPAAAPAASAMRTAGIEPSNIVKAPLPGLIIDVKVREGDRVGAGQSIILMEAMKMENQIQASCDGTVKRIFVKKGDSVAEGATLIEIERSAISSL